MKKKPDLTPKICVYCGKKFYRKRNKKTGKLESLTNFRKRKFCSRECYWKFLKEKFKGEDNPHWKKRIVKICPICGKKFEVLPSRKDKIYCSLKCAGLARRGKPCSEETKRKLREINIGKHMSKETRMKMRMRKLQNPTRYWLNRKRSKETIEKMRRFNIEHPNLIHKDTSIELKIEAELKKRKINYQKQVPLCSVAIVDFYLPEGRIVIQCDGDYWHNLPKCKEKDKRQTEILTNNGYKVFRFWEHEINKSAKECIDKILAEEDTKRSQRIWAAEN